MTTEARIGGAETEFLQSSASEGRVAGTLEEIVGRFVSAGRVGGLEGELLGRFVSSARIGGIVLEALQWPVQPVTPPAIWTVKPNWASTVLRTYEFLTDVLGSQSGDEQRRNLRGAPRRFYEISFTPFGADRAFVDLFLSVFGASEFYLPDFTEPSYATAPISPGDFFIQMDTDYQSFAEVGYALIATPDSQRYEVLGVSEVTSFGPGALTLTNPTAKAWPVRSRVYPCYLARLFEQPNATRHADGAYDITIKFWLQGPYPANLNAAPEDSYRGFPVFRTRPSEGDEIKTGYLRLTQLLDGDTGPTILTDTAGVPFFKPSHTFWLYGRQALYDFIGLIHYFQGRFNTFWVPTFYQDFELLGDIAPTTATLVVANNGLARVGLIEGRRDIYFDLRDGSCECRRIAGLAANDDGTLTLTFDTAFTGGLLAASVRRASFLMYARCDADSIELEHNSDIYGVATCTLPLQSIRDRT